VRTETEAVVLVEVSGWERRNGKGLHVRPDLIPRRLCSVQVHWRDGGLDTTISF
jgi:hypothetical protein